MTKKQTAARPYTTDYGTTQGHCATRQSALIAAFRYLVLNRVTHVTVEGPTGHAVVRMRAVFAGPNVQGVSVFVPKGTQLRRVA